ncbi:uncharacterized protein ARB_04398 [Trichophyton benhamiae CBS 112371]|uniref:Uncharacterized protein n=1 Tax=Arthroderma benhamiae (strain ATCC MYA-4681 / CBS 112371) TaxID=663331 RepID=D4AJE8_ARTBC|nr:uncharacterized protein ARB_04398 [Trichophyton benhamiae CBS 112371]EFE36871.1 hypothetical protein ARB_04398 [Trichophyton benhamiae CBS 112371]
MATSDENSALELAAGREEDVSLYMSLNRSSLSLSFSPFFLSLSVSFSSLSFGRFFSFGGWKEVLYEGKGGNEREVKEMITGWLLWLREQKSSS